MDRESLEALLGEGLSLEQIGRRVGRHPSTVSYWLGKYGMEAVNRDKHAARGQIEKEVLEKLVSAGLSISQIARELERGKASVRHWLKRYGLRTHTSKYRALNAQARGERAQIVSMTCREHGVTDFKLRADGGYRCLQCRTNAVTRRRRHVKRLLIEDAGGACALCGYDRHPGALHFHHLDPATKSFSLSEQGVARSIARARAEARKCVLLCSNCHAEVEGGLVSAPQ
jgi:transposase